VMPPVYAAGYVDLMVEVQGSNDLHWKGKFLIETPFTAPAHVDFPNNEHLEVDPEKLYIWWDHQNLTFTFDSRVDINLWGYRENTITPELYHIDTLATSVSNDGSYTVSPKDYRNKKLSNKILEFEIGLITVNLTSAIGSNSEMQFTP